MKNLKFLLVIYSILCIQYVNAQQVIRLNLSDSYPEAGEKIILTYNPAGAFGDNKKAIKASVYFMDYKKFQVSNISLKPDGNSLKGEFIAGKTAKAFFVKISSGGEVDNNNDTGYLYAVYKDKKPVVGAYASEAYFYSSGLGTEYAKVTKNIKKGAELYKKEFLLYPQNSDEYQKDYIALLPQLAAATFKTTIHIDTIPGEHYKSMSKLKADLAQKMINKPAPAFSLKDLDGKTVPLSDLKGKVVILDFWATWCTPCKASFPGMQLAVRKYKNNPNVKFLFVDLWETGDYYTDDIRKFIKDSHYDFHVLLDEKLSGSKYTKVGQLYNINAIPTKIIIDKKGNIRFTFTGGSATPNKLLDEVTAMIELVEKPNED
jgi:thiol-disulfide isomerase/thioredoxin